MNIALCYENIDPTRGGCETYIADLSRRLAGCGHEVHLYVSRLNAEFLPVGVQVHSVSAFRCPRVLKPWLFGRLCLQELSKNRHDVTIGFDKTWGMDIHYPQGGVYLASQRANLRKYSTDFVRHIASIVKSVDPAVRSFSAIEGVLYRYQPRSTFVAISAMTRWHMTKYYSIAPSDSCVLHAAIDPTRFDSKDRQAIRMQIRRKWGVDSSSIVGLFMAMNYRLKGLEPLLRSLVHLPREASFRLVVAGDSRTDIWQRMARQLGVFDRALFQGYCKDARSAYFGADFLIHPTFYDPCSLVALEAIACGLPIVTTRYNGAAEVLNPPHDSVIIDDPHHHVDLAEAISSFLDRERLATASTSARRTSERWTFDDHYRKIMLILEEVASRSRGRELFSRVA